LRALTCPAARHRHQPGHVPVLDHHPLGAARRPRGAAHRRASNSG